MSFPFYVNPEQMTQDKAEFARKGIARGKSIVTLEFSAGILMVAENPLRLQKLGEIYDRIAFAGVGKFSEFDRLRKMGVQWADVEGYRFSRDDVRAKALANLYSQVLGDEFTPDGCRIWDVQTREKLDKDRFRQSLGNVVESYEVVGRRLGLSFD